MAADVHKSSSPRGAATGKGKYGPSLAAFQGLRRRVVLTFATGGSFTARGRGFGLAAGSSHLHLGSLITSFRFHTQPIITLFEGGPQAGTRESLGVGRVPIWTILLLVPPLGGLGPPFCPRETFYFLIAIMKVLRSKNDGTLYTADDLLVCPAEALGCFWLELSVIGFEEGPSMETAVFRLQRLLDALGSWLWVTGWGPCPPCGGYPQRPVHLFLAKLLELKQGACAQHLPSA
ncbi:uncharacterized protein LOC132479577 [Mesoplodon densirostris]|uniref:uncharacterized protein LOC132479577 n=1 Tax=Mesoplodon densirostris TaxID=48708 RepID=UPI0028DC6283|nr:uncharacterized protein LOC132479577 [Mesoplodon densirostris]